MIDFPTSCEWPIYIELFENASAFYRTPRPLMEVEI